MPDKSTSMRGAILLMGALSCLFWTQQNGYAMYLTPYMSVLGASSTITGFMLGAYGFPQIFLRVPLGIYTDHSSRYKQLIIIGNGCCMLAMLGFWLCTNPAIFILLRFLVGISAATWACYGVLFGGYFSATGSMKSGEYMAAFTYIGALVGNLACWAAYGINGDYRTSFLVMFFLSALAFIGSFFIKDDVIQVERPPVTWELVRSLLRRKTIWLAGIIALVLDFITYGIANGFLSQFAADLGVSVSGITIMSLVSCAVSCLSAVTITPFLRKKFGTRTMLIITSLVLVAYCMCLPFCQNVLALILMRAVMSISHGIVVSSVIGLSVDGVPYESQAACISLLYTFTGIGAMVGPILTGCMTQWFDMSTAFRVVGVTQFIGLVCALFLPKEKKTAN